MEYLLGNTTQIGSSEGYININIPQSSKIGQASIEKKFMSINSALSMLKLDNLW